MAVSSYHRSFKLTSWTYQHVVSRKHRKFAADDSNWVQLDSVLARVRRRTKDEVSSSAADWNTNQQNSDDLSPADQDIAMMLPSNNSELDGDVRWEEWVDADEL